MIFHEDQTITQKKTIVLGCTIQNWKELAICQASVETGLASSEGVETLGDVRS